MGSSSIGSPSVGATAVGLGWAIGLVWGAIGSHNLVSTRVERDEDMDRSELGLVA
jgi:hypothetical protein